MKKTLMSLSLLATVFVLSCKGPAGQPGFDGPPGPQGPQGPAGTAGPAGPQTLGTVFDVKGAFTTANDFRIYFEFPKDKIEVFDTDVVMVYRLWEKIADPKGDIPVYRPLPQTVFLPKGAMQYSFDHTFLDASMFLDTQFDRTTLEAKWTTDQTFRVVVIPADFAKNGRLKALDYNNYQEVSDLLQIDQRKVETYQAKQ